MPNGIITGYEVSYELTDSSQTPTTRNTGLETNFTTPSDLEPGSEVIFSVTASTSVGPGEPASITVSTLPVPRELKQFSVRQFFMSFFLHSCNTRSGGVI